MNEWPDIDLHAILYHGNSTFSVYFVWTWQYLATTECILQLMEKTISMANFLKYYLL